MGRRKKSKEEIEALKRRIATTKSWVNVPMGKILNQVGKEMGMDPKHVKEIFQLSWYNIKETLNENEFPNISIEHFGRLLPRITKVEKLKEKYLDQLMVSRRAKRRNPQRIETYKKKYEAALAACDRIKKEKKRKREIHKKK